MKLKIEGISKREWSDKQSGEVKTFVDLHCIVLNRPSDGLTGNEVKIVNASTFPGVNELRVGSTYNADFDIIETSKGAFAKLISMELTR